MGTTGEESVSEKALAEIVQRGGSDLPTSPVRAAEGVEGTLGVFDFAIGDGL